MTPKKLIHLDIPDLGLEEYTMDRLMETAFPKEDRHSVLSDASIIRAVECGLLLIDPFNPEHVQPASYDLTVAQDILLMPKECALADTIERLYLPTCLKGELSGRSSVARQFVAVHCTGGYVDPGFTGTLTLELINHSNEIREYQRGDRLVQIAFAWLDKPAVRPYHGRYMNQSGPTASRFQHGDR